VVGQVFRWPVGGAAVVEEVALFVGEQPPPGAGLVGGDAARDRGRDRAAAREFTWLFVQAEQGRKGDGDLDGRTQAVFTRQLVGHRSMQRVQRQLHGGVGAALIGGPLVVTGDASGEGVDRGHERARAGVRKEHPDLTHPVRDRSPDHPPLRDGLDVAFLRRLRRNSQNGFADGPFEVREHLLGRFGQHRGLDCGGGVVVERHDGFGQVAGVVHGDLAPLLQVEGGGQPGHRFGELQPIGRGQGRES
jgi:hypothetical protein